MSRQPVAVTHKATLSDGFSTARQRVTVGTPHAKGKNMKTLRTMTKSELGEYVASLESLVADGYDLMRSTSMLAAGRRFMITRFGGSDGVKSPTVCESDNFLACNIIGAYIRREGFTGCWADDIDHALAEVGIKTADGSDLEPSRGEIARLASGTVITWSEQWAKAEVA